jgi:hypothetical protein
MYTNNERGDTLTQIASRPDWKTKSRREQQNVCFKMHVERKRPTDKL